MSLIPFVQYSERVVGENSPLYTDVANRPLKFVTLTSGLDDTQDFLGFASGSVGSGNPEGNVLGRVGDVYGDRASTTGVIWTKTSGNNTKVGWRTLFWGAGTVGTLSKFGTVGSLEDSLISESGSAITINADTINLPLAVTFNATNSISLNSTFLNITTSVDGINLVSQTYFNVETQSGVTFIVNDTFEVDASNGINLFDSSSFGIDIESGGEIDILAGTDGTGALALSGKGGTSSIDLDNNIVATSTNNIRFISNSSSVNLELLSTGFVFTGFVNSNFSPVDATWTLGTTTQRWIRLWLSSNLAFYRDSLSGTGFYTGITMQSQTTGSVHWSIYPINTESGSTGYDLLIQRSNLSGDFAWLTVTRSNGAYSIVGDGTLTGNLSVTSTGYFGDTAANFSSIFSAGDSLLVKTRFHVIREANAGVMRLGRVNGTLSSPTAVLVNNAIAIFNPEGWDGSAMLTCGAITWNATENWSASARGAALFISLVQTGTTTNRIVANIDGGDGSLSLGASSHAQTYALYSSSIFAPILDSGAATDLLLKRNGITQLTLGSLLASFAGDVDIASGKVYKINTTQVISSRNTGWTAPTATQSKAGFGNGATATQIEQNLSAVINALITHGLLGA